MRDEKSLVTAKKRQSPQVQIRAVFVALISKFQSLITAERPNTFQMEIYLRALNGLESRGGGGTPYNGLYGEAPPERGTFFRFQV